MGKVIIFPVGKESSADAYIAFCDHHYPDTTPGAIWYNSEKVDNYGQRVVAYMGPGGVPWRGGDMEEPEGGEGARADGVISSDVVWPSSDQ